MTSLVSIPDLMKQVNKAVSSARLGGGRRIYSFVRFYVPGLSTLIEIPGINVQDVLVPTAHTEESQKPEALAEALAYLAEDNILPEARQHLCEQFGKQVIEFVLYETVCELRVARLIWALGKGCEHEVGPDTLVIKSPLGEYGVRNGMLVGGPYAGYPQPIDTTKVTEVERVITSKAQHLVEIRTLLESRRDPSDFHLFSLLYARAEWDKKILLKTLLMVRPGLSRLNRDEIIRSLMTSSDPYKYLFNKLVPLCMPYGDFITVFGTPNKRGNLGESPRRRLAIKVKNLPFFREE